MKIEEFKNITIAYMRNTGAYGAKNETLMHDFKIFLQKHHLMKADTVILGIALDNLATTPKENLRYDVGMILYDNEKTNLATRQIEDGSYAVFEVVHTKEDVMNFWQSLPQLTANLSIDQTKPIIERYAAEKIKQHMCEFCIPLITV